MTYGYEGMYEYDCTNTIIWNDNVNKETSEKLLKLAKKYKQFRREYFAKEKTIQ